MNSVTQNYEKEMLEWRHDFHAHPELNFDLDITSSKVANISNCPVIISGGVSTINDVIKARNMENIEGIIVGKAIYDGDIKLEELVKEDA